jgi:hypothetical protein
MNLVQQLFTESVSKHSDIFVIPIVCLVLFFFRITLRSELFRVEFI